jgi:hypothetical protein
LGIRHVPKIERGPGFSGPLRLPAVAAWSACSLSRCMPVRWTSPDTVVRGAVSLLGFRRQLLVEAGTRRRVLHLEPPANLPRYRSRDGEAPSGSLAVRHLAGPGMF